jgi:hypothetical protein
MDEGGSRDGASLPEEAPGKGPGEGGAPSLGTLEDMLRKAPDTDISLHRGPFTTVGNLEFEWCSYTRDLERLMKEGSRNSAFLCKGFHEEDLEGGRLYWRPRKIC